VLSVIEGELGTDCHSREHHPVLVSIVSVHGLETVELLGSLSRAWLERAALLSCQLEKRTHWQFERFLVHLGSHYRPRLSRQEQAPASVHVERS
jgi:hypothetical protein